MPELIQNSEHLDKKDTHLTPWYDLIQQILPNLGWDSAAITHMFPNPIPNEVNFNTNGRAWYKLTEEDKQLLKNYVYLWGHLKPPNELLDKSTENKLKLPTLRDLFKQMLTAKYLVISCNPVDKLLASTNQPWGSCISFDSEYNSGYAYNLPTLFPQQSMLTCFLTKGEYGNYELKGQQFKTIKMKTRCFIYLLENNKVGIGKTYPAQCSAQYGMMLMEELVNKAGFDTIKPVKNPNHPTKIIEWNNDFFPLKYPFQVFKDTKYNERSAYLDNINISRYLNMSSKFCSTNNDFSNYLETNGTTLREFINANEQDICNIYGDSSDDYDDDYDDEDEDENYY